MSIVALLGVDSGDAIAGKKSVLTSSQVVELTYSRLP